MPMVGGKKFPYTEKGKKEAAQAMASVTRQIKPPAQPKIAALKKKQASRSMGGY